MRIFSNANSTAVQRLADTILPRDGSKNFTCISLFSYLQHPSFSESLYFVAAVAGGSRIDGRYGTIGKKTWGKTVAIKCRPRHLNTQP
jgi:hypothetical protein